MFQTRRTLRFIGIIIPRRRAVFFRREQVKEIAEVKQPDPDEKLLDLWARIKSKIWHFDIQNRQITDWFNKNYHLEVGITNFDPPRPASFFSLEMLSAFYQALDRYAGRQ